MDDKKFSVILSRRSEIMMLSHTEFLVRVSVVSARKLLSEFKKVTGRIAENPHQFPYADELDANGIPLQTYRKAMFYSRYKALFVVEGNNAYVDAIIDCRQENNDIF